MTMHAVFFKENEGVSMDGPRWTGLGSPVAAAAAVYGEAFNHSKLSCLELSAGGNNHFSAANKESEDHLITAKPNTTHFTLFSGDCKTGESREKTTLQNASSAMDFRGHFELGFGQSLICAKYPYPDQCYGIYSTYGTQFAGRSMLPLSMSSDGGPIFVNAKQYNGIMRRRKKRAEAEMVNKMIKIRKPYLHLSRHLHAMRRPRGNGGRFLNTKTSGGETTAPKKQGYMEKQKHLQKLIKVLESDGTNSSSSRSDSPGGSDVTSDHDLFSRAFQLNNLHTTSFHHFSDVGNTALGMAMVTGNNYLKV